MKNRIYISESFVNDYKQADKFMLYLLFFHWLVATLVTSYEYNMYSYGFINGAIIFVANLILYKNYRGTSIFRYSVAISLMLFSSIFIQQYLGRIEIHFHVFIALAFLTLYKDIYPVIIATLTTLVYHILFNYFQSINLVIFDTPVQIFNYGCGWDIVMLHTLFAITEAFVLVFIVKIQIKNHIALVESEHNLKKEIDKSQLKNKELMANQKELEEINIRINKQQKQLTKYINTFSENVIASSSDLKGNITYASKALCEISGYSEEELLGQPHSILKSSDTPKSVFTDMWKTIQSGLAWNGELKNNKKDAGYYWVRTTIIPDCNDNGDIVGYSSVRHEITKEKEIIRKDKQLIEQSRMAQMGELISMIAHQWRQPLSAISATSMNVKLKSELKIFDFSKEEEAKKYEAFVNNSLDKIDNFIGNLTEIVDNFRNFYKQNKKAVSVKLDKLVVNSLTIIDGLLHNGNIKLIEEYNSNEEIEVHDSELIQVVINILKNAHDNFMEKQIKNPYIKIITEDRTISIYDNGGGIPESIIENIFDPYFTTKAEQEGTGLGLYMSKMIVEEHHNGRLSVHNTDDGVCFRIEL